MKLKVQQVFDVTRVLAVIVSENRPLPQKGRYRVARLHAKLLPEFNTINDQRSAKIATYDHKAPVLNGVVVQVAEGTLLPDGATLQAAVPDDKMPEFRAWWAELASVEIDVDVEPIPLDQLCIDGQEGTISLAEFGVLGDLVAE